MAHWAASLILYFIQTCSMLADWTNPILKGLYKSKMGPETSRSTIGRPEPQEARNVKSQPRQWVDLTHQSSIDVCDQPIRTICSTLGTRYFSGSSIFRRMPIKNVRDKNRIEIYWEKMLNPRAEILCMNLSSTPRLSILTKALEHKP